MTTLGRMVLINQGKRKSVKEIKDPEERAKYERLMREQALKKQLSAPLSGIPGFLRQIQSLIEQQLQDGTLPYGDMAQYPYLEVPEDEKDKKAPLTFEEKTAKKVVMVEQGGKWQIIQEQAQKQHEGKVRQNEDLIARLQQEKQERHDKIIKVQEELRRKREVEMQAVMERIKKRVQQGKDAISLRKMNAHLISSSKNKEDISQSVIGISGAEESIASRIRRYQSLKTLKTESGRPETEFVFKTETVDSMLKDSRGQTGSSQPFNSRLAARSMNPELQSSPKKVLSLPKLTNKHYREKIKEVQINSYRPIHLKNHIDSNILDKKYAFGRGLEDSSPRKNIIVKLTPLLDLPELSQSATPSLLKPVCLPTLSISSVSPALHPSSLPKLKERWNSLVEALKISVASQESIEDNQYSQYHQNSRLLNIKHPSLYSAYLSMLSTIESKLDRLDPFGCQERTEKKLNAISRLSTVKEIAEAAIWQSNISQIDQNNQKDSDLVGFDGSQIAHQTQGEHQQLPTDEIAVKS